MVVSWKKVSLFLQKPFKIPIAPVPPVVNEGIVNTNAFVNSGGGGEIRYDNSFLPDPPNIPITGGFDGGYGADPISGDLPGGGNIADEFGIDGDVYAGTGINNIGPSGNLPGGGNLYDEFQKDGKDYSLRFFGTTDPDHDIAKEIISSFKILNWFYLISHFMKLR